MIGNKIENNRFFFHMHLQANNIPNGLLAIVDAAQTRKTACN